jgi:hypothetical protein
MKLLSLDELRAECLRMFCEGVQDKDKPQDWKWGDLNVRLRAVRFHVKLGSRPPHHFEYKYGDGNWLNIGTAEGAAGLVTGYVLALKKEMT